MKKIVGGIGFMLTGTLLYLTACIVGHLNYKNKTEWQTSVGRYWQSIIDTGLLPAIIIGFIFLIIGTVLTLWGIYKKSEE